MLDAQGRVRPHANLNVRFEDYFEHDFVRARVLVEHVQDCVKEGLLLFRFRQSNQNGARLVCQQAVESLHLIHNYAWWVIVGKLQPTGYQRRQFRLQHSGVSPVGVGPGDALGTTGIVLDAKQGEAITLFCGA